MGKEDLAAKRYLSDSKRFADLFNHVVFGGEGVLNPAGLRAMDASASSGGMEKHRDVLKEWSRMSDGEATYAILGLEEQTAGHPAMPVRCALYDAMSYGGQVGALAKRNRREGMAGASPAEFLSGLWETDRLRPVITLVFYLSPDDWTWPETLHGVIDEEVDKRLMAFVPDYRMNLVAPARMSDEELDSFSTELGLAIKYLRYSADKKALGKMMKEDRRFYSMDVETAEFLNIVTGSNLRIEPERGRVDMCKAIDDMRAESERIGRREGKLEGRREGRLESLRSLMANTGWGLARALDALGVPEDERAPLAAELGVAL